MKRHLPNALSLVAPLGGGWAVPQVPTFVTVVMLIALVLMALIWIVDERLAELTQARAHELPPVPKGWAGDDT